ncbi:MAG: energy-coupling factor transporter transmembrane component T family protein [Candidatus Thorarchaeota archaeon]
MAFIQQSNRSKIAINIDIDPRTKLLFLFAVSILSVLIEDFIFQLFLFDVVLIIVIVSKADLVKIWRFLKPTFAVIIPIFIIQVFFSYNKNNPIVTIPESSPILANYVIISIGSILFAASITFRVLTIALSSVFFSVTTDTNEFLQALRKLGIPYEIAISVGLIIYFLPMVVEETTTVRDSLETRGVSIRRGRFIHRIKVFGILVSAILLNFIEKSKFQAIAMDSRGFNSKRKKTTLKAIKLKVQDYIISLFILCVIGGLIAYFWKEINLFKNFTI